MGADGELDGVLNNGIVECFNVVEVDGIVGINKADIFAVSDTDATISGGRKPAIFLMKNDDT